MSDTDREPDHDDAPTSRIPAQRGGNEPAEPVTGAPAGSSDVSEPDDWVGPAGRKRPVRPGPAADTGADDDAAPRGAASSGLGSASSSASAATAPGRGGRGRVWRVWRLGPINGEPMSERKRRQRRWFVAGIAVAAAVVVVALCAGALSVVSTVDDVRDRAADAQETRVLRETDCLDLERRLNQLGPPGATGDPAARATAIRNENIAVRLYLDQLDDQRDEDAWRQLLDARTVFADALDRQAKSRTPAFYVAPRTTDGRAVTDLLMQWSPAPCAGPVRRLAVPEL
ncbi:hypothetical protein BJ973_008029 [Actinoplanes tereljensis]|uniref:Uncharacterized protein n=1 Tax=Paractinoplanes tereljensis TaxID=571912 RepID=A0A919NSY8_9ACTN|nr:hypothetical protein [Actinoplanes tereljensis]GIF24550.1 hypothetical protein Ate02nite_72800 [Actinoplanes tereljensis]